MKPIRLSVLACLVAAALSSPTTFLASETITPVAISINKVHAENASVMRGDSLRTVQETLGMPYRRLSSDVHLFIGYHTDLPGSDGSSCNVLMVTYTKGKVTDLKLLNSTACRLLATNLKNAISPATVAVTVEGAK